MKEKKNEGKAIIFIVLILIAIAIIAGVCWYFFVGKDMFKNEKEGEIKETKKTSKVEASKEEVSSAPSEFEIKDSNLSEFDLEFLKLENEEKNKVYSPLSIKYTLAMLNEGANGNTRKEISRILGKYEPKKYINNKNMSFANAFFVRDSYKKSIIEEYTNNVADIYGAEVIYDSFESANKINSWVSENTFDLINNLLTDDDVENLNYALINALAIDMDWEERFLVPENWGAEYNHEKFAWTSPYDLVNGKFKDVDKDISGMQIMGSINKYNIVEELGEDNIRKTVEEELRKFLEEDTYGDGKYLIESYSETNDVEDAIKNYLDTYIEEIDKNYKDIAKTTDFSFFVNDDVKVFGKDLKKYDDVQLEYVAIMPKNEDLSSFINDLDADKTNELINSLKPIELESFNDGVVTVINGYIPKFKFEYDLELMKDLEEMGIKEVFDVNKANLENLTTEKNAYIGKTVHKANIEFTQDGIKAAATTMAGGRGGGGLFDYLYDVPIEKINLTFDNPYMFIIRDKDTSEVWFAGTVYEPLLYEDDESIDIEENMKEFWINGELVLVD